MKNPVAERFSEFYDKWIWKLEEILPQLLEVSRQRTAAAAASEQELEVLVSRVTTHLKEYFTVKWGAAREDVLVFFTPLWLTPLETAFLWVTGWKPSTAFKVLELVKKRKTSNNNSNGGGGGGFGMTEEQERKVEVLRARTRMEEEKVEREMERQQVAMADRKMVELAKLSSRAAAAAGDVMVDGAADAAVKGVLASLEKIMKASDCVRLKTLKGVLDVLTPLQCVEFLAAYIAMQLRLRQWGKKRDALGPYSS